MFDPTQAAYVHGEKTAFGTFGLTKEAVAPLIGAGLMMAGRAALPWLARGAGAIAQTGTAMAANKMMSPSAPQGQSPVNMPGMAGQGNLPGMVNY